MNEEKKPKPLRNKQVPDQELDKLVTRIKWHVVLDGKKIDVIFCFNEIDSEVIILININEARHPPILAKIIDNRTNFEFSYDDIRWLLWAYMKGKRLPRGKMISKTVKVLNNNPPFYWNGEKWNW